jgi:hypothetical protein
MRMNYSEKHIAAFNRWKSVGSLDLTDAEVAALADEDPALGDHVRTQRYEREAALVAKVEAESRAAASQRPNAAPPRSLAKWLLNEMLDSFRGMPEGKWSDETRNKWYQRNGALPVTNAIFKRHMDEATKKNAARDLLIADLQKRIAELEARPSLSYKGVWRADETYAQGDIVSDHGSMWHARSANVSRRPGQESSATMVRPSASWRKRPPRCSNQATSIAEVVLDLGQAIGAALHTQLPDIGALRRRWSSQRPASG